MNPRLLALLGAASLVACQAILLVLIFLRPDLDPTWHTISEWAWGPWGWLMSVGFVVSGLGYAFLALTLTRLRTRGLVGRILLWVCAVGAVGVGLFRTDPLGSVPVPPTTTGLLHILFGTSQLVLLPWAALLISLALARTLGTSKGDKRWMVAFGLLPLAGFLSFAVYTAIFVAPLGDAHGPGVNIGIPPRVAFFCYAVWVVWLSLRLRRT